jgi:hypothetical protein
MAARHEVARREAIVRTAREAAEAAVTRRDWAGLADGAPVGTGVPRRDWLESRAVTPNEARAAANVALLRLADGSLATAFHLRLARRGGAPLSCVVTAAHAMPTSAAARRATATFTAAGDGAPRGAVACDPSTLFVVACGADVAACALRADLARLRPVRCCVPAAFAAGDALHVVQHPNGNPLVALHGEVALASTSTQYFLHTADTLAGSSGAPLFDARWRLAGVHVGTTALHVHGRSVPYNEGCHLQPLLQELRRRGYDVADEGATRSRRSRSRRASSPR